MERNKLMNGAKNLDVFVRIGGNIFSAVSIVCAICAVLVLIFGNQMLDVNSLTLDLDYIKIHLANKFQVDDSLMRIYLVIGLLVIGILCYAVSHLASLIRQILAPMKDGRHFEAHVPQTLRKIAWVVLICGGVAQILGVAERMLAAGAFPMDEIFSSPAIAGLEYSFSIDFSFVLVFCVIIFLSYIFSYGQALQQESDETL